MKNQTFTAWQAGRRIALGALVAASVLSATDRSGAAPGPGFVERTECNQSNVQRGPATPTPTPSRQDGQRPSSPPRVPWWKDPAVIKEINLTPDQAARIDAIWRKRETEMHGVAMEQKRQQDEFARLVEERKVGVDVIGLQFDRAEVLRSMLSKSRAIALYQTSLILSAEQNKALKAIGERNRRERGRGFTSGTF